MFFFDKEMKSGNASFRVAFADQNFQQYTVSFVRQVQALVKREFWILLGDKTTLYTKLFMYVKISTYSHHPVSLKPGREYAELWTFLINENDL